MKKTNQMMNMKNPFYYRKQYKGFNIYNIKSKKARIPERSKG